MAITDHPPRPIASMPHARRCPSTPTAEVATVAPALPPTVAAIGELHLTGNLLPTAWYHHLKLPSGHTDLVGCTILGEIVYQYRPLAVRDETTGEVLHHVKRFARDQFCAPLAYFAQKFALSPDQVRQGLKRLEQAGLIRRQYRTLTVAGRTVPGMTFIEPVAEAIRAITPAPAGAPRPVARVDAAVQTPPGAVSPPGGAVQIPVYRDSLQTPAKPPPPTTAAPALTASVPLGEESGRRREQVLKNRWFVIASHSKPLFSPTPTTTNTPNRPATTLGSVSPSALLFDFHLAALSETEQAALHHRLARLPLPLAQAVLDEYNSAVGRQMPFRNRWGWFEYLIRKAQRGEFIPTADLAERRQAQQAQAIAEAQASAPTASTVWLTHRQRLQERLGDAAYLTYVLPLRGVEERDTLWLEAPNGYVAEWVVAHRALIGEVLQPHTALMVGVRVG